MTEDLADWDLYGQRSPWQWVTGHYPRSLLDDAMQNLVSLARAKHGELDSFRWTWWAKERHVHGREARTVHFALTNAGRVVRRG
jgi:hypothetical protein